MRKLAWLSLAGMVTLFAAASCGDEFSDNCEQTNSCSKSSATSASTSGSGAAGGGGATPCGVCTAPTPLCDESTNTCVACLLPDDCENPTASRCEEGACVPCEGPADCAHIGGAGICNDGACVECALGDEDACGGKTTCNLLTNACVAVAPESVGNCEPCSNDVQCETDHRCIPLDFEGAHHGYYCLLEQNPSCERPFFGIRKTSVNGETADYCGIDEDRATCEAVIALLDDWRCPSGVDGMCGPVGMPEVAVPGAVCEVIGAVGADRCTYACAGVQQCPLAIESCGDGDETPPGWCGG
jgi:hypothetical protein